MTVFHTLKSGCISFGRATRHTFGCEGNSGNAMDDDDDDNHYAAASSSGGGAAPAFVEINLLRSDLNHQRHFPDNSIRTAKYTLLTGLPLSLLYQFYKISNFYFLLVMVITLVPGASPINPFSSVVPLCIVLGAGIIKDLWEDWKRQKADALANQMLVHVLRSSMDTSENAQHNETAEAEDENEALGRAHHDEEDEEAANVVVSPQSMAALEASADAELASMNALGGRGGSGSSRVKNALNNSELPTRRPPLNAGSTGSTKADKRGESKTRDSVAGAGTGNDGGETADGGNGDPKRFVHFFFANEKGQRSRSSSPVWREMATDAPAVTGGQPTPNRNKMHEDYVTVTPERNGGGDRDEPGPSIHTNNNTMVNEVFSTRGRPTAPAVTFQAVRSCDVYPGDVMLFRLGEEVKADCLILNTSLPDGLTYIETANLDGETNAKTRRAKIQTVEALGTVEDIVEQALGVSSSDTGAVHRRMYGLGIDGTPDNHSGNEKQQKGKVTPGSGCCGDGGSADLLQRTAREPADALVVAADTEQSPLRPRSPVPATSLMEKPAMSSGGALAGFVSPPASSKQVHLEREEREAFAQQSQHAGYSVGTAHLASTHNRCLSDSLQQHTGAGTAGGNARLQLVRSGADLTPGSTTMGYGTAISPSDVTMERGRHQRHLTLDERMAEEGVIPVPRPLQQLSAQYERAVHSRTSSLAVSLSQHHPFTLQHGHSNRGESTIMVESESLTRQARTGTTGEHTGSSVSGAVTRGPSSAFDPSALNPVTPLLDRRSSPQDRIEGVATTAAREDRQLSSGDPSDDTMDKQAAAAPGVVLISCAPTPDLSTWFGQLRLPSGEMVPLGIDQFLPRGCMVRNTDWVLGAVVYTGRHTKMLLNLRPKPNKITNMTRRLNQLNVFLFLLNQALMFLLCGLSIWNKHRGLTRLEGSKSAFASWYMQWSLERYSDATLFWWRYLTNFVLLSYLIPMSLYVTLEFNKAMQMLLIAADKRMAVFDEFTGAIKQSRPKTSELNCQLGHVRYIFTDKTGTLTENLMTYVGGVVDGHTHSETNEPGGLGRALLRRRGSGGGGGGGSRQMPSMGSALADDFQQSSSIIPRVSEDTTQARRTSSGAPAAASGETAVPIDSSVKANLGAYQLPSSLGLPRRQDSSIAAAPPLPLLGLTYKRGSGLGGVAIAPPHARGNSGDGTGTFDGALATPGPSALMVLGSSQRRWAADHHSRQFSATAGAVASGSMYGGTFSGGGGLAAASEATLERDPVYRYLRALALCHSIVCFPVGLQESNTGSEPGAEVRDVSLSRHPDEAHATDEHAEENGHKKKKKGKHHKQKQESSSSGRRPHREREEADAVDADSIARREERRKRRHDRRGSADTAPGAPPHDAPATAASHHHHHHRHNSLHGEEKRTATAAVMNTSQRRLFHQSPPLQQQQQQQHARTRSGQLPVAASLLSLTEISGGNFVDIPYAVPAGPSGRLDFAPYGGLDSSAPTDPLLPPSPLRTQHDRVRSTEAPPPARRTSVATVAATRHEQMLSIVSAGFGADLRSPFQPAMQTSLSSFTATGSPAAPVGTPGHVGLKASTINKLHGRTSSASWYQNRYFHTMMHSRNLSHSSARMLPQAMNSNYQGGSPRAPGRSPAARAPLSMSGISMGVDGTAGVLPGNPSAMEDFIDRSKIYEGQSLDEIALVNAARENGFSLFERTAKQMYVKMLGRVLCYDIIAEQEFTPQRKLMSILLQRRPELDSETAANAASAGTSAHYHRTTITATTAVVRSECPVTPPTDTSAYTRRGLRDSSSLLGSPALGGALPSQGGFTELERSSNCPFADDDGEQEGARQDPAAYAAHVRSSSAFSVSMNGLPPIHTSPSMVSVGDRANATMGLGYNVHKYLLLVKGADSSMMEIVNMQKRSNQRVKEAMLSELDAMAKLGLRTLVLGQRYLSEAEVVQWLPIFNEAQCAMQDRSERLHEAYAMLEKDVDLVGTTAVEDKLQEEVPQTLEFCIQASIVVWMLTGDKRETAVTIAHTSGLVSAAYTDYVCHLDVSGIVEEEALLKQQKQYEERARQRKANGEGSGSTTTEEEEEDDDKEERDSAPQHTARRPTIAGTDAAAAAALLTVGGSSTTGTPPINEKEIDGAGCGNNANADSFLARKLALIEEQLQAAEAKCDAGHETFGAQVVVIVVDGKTLDFIFQDNARAYRFFLLGSRCRSAVCCRMTPLQKAKIVRMFKRNMKAVALAIGDGANDVSMIQESSIGVGIMGLEGSQAELASDYAIPKFRFLKRLLFVHGRFSVFREAHCIIYSLYKNVIVTVGMIAYQFYACYSGQALMDSWLLAMFSIFFCSLQPLMIGILDKDVEDELAESLPTLYPPLSREYMYFSYPYIFKWLLDGMIEGVIFFFVLMYCVGVQDNLYPHMTPAIEDYGTTFFTMLVLVADFRVATLVTYYMVLFALAVALEIIFVPILELIYSAMNNLAGSNWCVKTANELYGTSGKFWMMLFFACGVLVIVTMASNMYIQLFAPWQNAGFAMRAARASSHRVPYEHMKKALKAEYAQLLVRYDELVKQQALQEDPSVSASTLNVSAAPPQQQQQPQSAHNAPQSEGKEKAA